MAELLQEPELLLEYGDSRGVSVGVDRTIGILQGVKLIGLESRNGRRYRESALAAAAALYEEAKVNVNHPKEGPLAPRDYQDRLGVIRGVELRAGEGLFGDLHFNPKHALAEQLLWDAEHNPHNVGFSHNVLARLTRAGETVVVEEITKVQSVDLVADPATTQGLFEQATEGEQAAISSYPSWDALTKDVLELHRPDLLAELQWSEKEQLLQQLEEAEARVSLLQKKQRIYEVLCEHQLSIAGDSAAGRKSSSRQVSSRFVKLLLNTASDDELVALVAERAELVQPATDKRPAGSQRPHSRDQMSVFPKTPVACATAHEFAANLKSSLNSF